MSRRRFGARSWAPLLLALALVASACGGAEEEPTEVAEPEEVEEVEEAEEEPTGEPIRVGGSLALTGFLSPNGLIHKVAGELYVDRLNAAGGLLGRPVEFIIIDDESSPDKAAAAYERLITEEQVDMIMGPYGTGTIAAAIQVAERHGYVIPHHTGSLTYTYGYDCAFPAWSSGRYPNQTIMGDILDMLEATDDPPETIGFLVNQFPGSNYVAYGSDEGDAGDRMGAVQVAKDRGYEVVVDVAYPTDIADFGPLAARVRQAKPDFLWVGGLGLDAANLIQAMEALNYRPKGEFYLWSAPAPLEQMGDPGQGVMLASMFELTMPLAQSQEIQEIAASSSGRRPRAPTRSSRRRPPPLGWAGTSWWRVSREPDRPIRQPSASGCRTTPLRRRQEGASSSTSTRTTTTATGRRSRSCRATPGRSSGRPRTRAPISCGRRLRPRAE